MTSPWADRDVLTGSQYRTDSNLAARRSIYAFQRPGIDLPAVVLDLARLHGTEAVADIGCGNGAYLAELNRRGHRGSVVGIDMSAGMLAAARGAVPGVTVLRGDAGRLPLADACVDVTLARACSARSIGTTSPANWR
ncbi:MAG: class I SAM-dependent methyltransferase [Streptosporangiaceae bacterium]